MDRSRYLMTVLFLDDHAAELQHRVLFQRPEFCGACHTHSVPSEVNPAQPLIDDKIAEWRAGMYGPRGDAQPVKTCLGCHMPDTIESYQTEEVPSHRFQSGNTGLAAIYGRDPRYDEFASRYFLGIQQAKFTHAEAVTLAQQVLTRGIVTLSVSVESAPVSLPGELRLRTSVRNQGVGHDFPAGPADLVEVWLQVEVHDSRGSLVWSSGVPSEDGTLPADSYRFGEAWYDAEGRRLRHHEAWRLAEVRERRRVPSGGVDRGRFEFLVAPDISGPLKVQVRLRHRRLSPEFTRWVLGASSEVLPVTDLQLASLEVSLPLAARGGGSP